MIKTISFEIEVTGDVSNDDIKEYLELLLECGTCSQNNPFIEEDSGAEISCYDVQVS